tara:strand:+ start:7553 stop:8029 length:477 start_codon:yes stop_codon:yes gene_type:complete
MECIICFENIQNSCVGSCMHHFCYKCLIKWINFGGSKCPICKKFIYEIKLDKEFDIINNNNNNNNNNIVSEYTKKTLIDFSDSKPPGITLSTNRGIGLKISKLKKNDKFFEEGFCVNDIIIFLNNVPCVDHSESIKIINQVYENKRELWVETLIRKNK